MSDVKDVSGRPIAWPAPVRRVALTWDGDRWSVSEEIDVASMTLPASDPLPDGEKTRGFWFEAVDAGGRTLYRQAIDDPLAGMEMFDGEGGVTRVPHKGHGVTIEVLLPDLPGLLDVHLVSHDGRRDDDTRTVLRLHGKRPPGAPRRQGPNDDAPGDSEHQHPDTQ